jgi:hypothetical protein
MTEPGQPTVEPAPSSDTSRFRRTLVRVMSVQVVTLLLLGLLQLIFSR